MIPAIGLRPMTGVLLLASVIWTTASRADDQAVSGTLAASAETVPDFATQVLPVLTQAGCNSGACHGAAAGRGGLQLSLFAGDPQQDYEAIGRARIQPAAAQTADGNRPPGRTAPHQTRRGLFAAAGLDPARLPL